MDYCRRPLGPGTCGRCGRRLEAAIRAVGFLGAQVSIAQQVASLSRLAAIMLRGPRPDGAARPVLAESRGGNARSSGVPA